MSERKRVNTMFRPLAPGAPEAVKWMEIAASEIRDLRKEVERLDELVNMAVTILDTLERGREITGIKIDRARYTTEAKAALIAKWNAEAKEAGNG